MQNKGLRTTGKFPGRTPVRELHTAFNLPYVYDLMQATSTGHTKAREWTEHIRSTGQGEARHRKYKRLKLGGGQAYDRPSD
jgi:hypothetical protein